LTTPQDSSEYCVDLSFTYAVLGIRTTTPTRVQPPTTPK